MNSSKSDFTQGSILGKLIPFMVPILGALVLQAAYGAGNDIRHCFKCVLLYMDEPEKRKVILQEFFWSVMRKFRVILLF